MGHFFIGAHSPSSLGDILGHRVPFGIGGFHYRGQTNKVVKVFRRDISYFSYFGINIFGGSFGGKHERFLGGVYNIINVGLIRRFFGLNVQGYQGRIFLYITIGFGGNFNDIFFYRRSRGRCPFSFVFGLLRRLHGVNKIRFVWVVFGHLSVSLNVGFVGILYRIIRFRILASFLFICSVKRWGNFSSLSWKLATAFLVVDGVVVATGVPPTATRAMAIGANF